MYMSSVAAIWNINCLFCQRIFSIANEGVCISRCWVTSIGDFFFFSFTWECNRLLCRSVEIVGCITPNILITIFCPIICALFIFVARYYLLLQGLERHVLHSQRVSECTTRVKLTSLLCAIQLYGIQLLCHSVTLNVNQMQQAPGVFERNQNMRLHQHNAGKMLVDSPRNYSHSPHRHHTPRPHTHTHTPHLFVSLGIDPTSLICKVTDALTWYRAGRM